MLFKTISVIFLFVISYLRHTYHIYPNFVGDPLFIKIRGGSDTLGSTALPSLITFVILFALANFLIAQSFNRDKRSFWLMSYAGLMFISAILYVVFKMTEVDMIFRLGSILKNFLLSPVFTFFAYLMFKFSKIKY